MTITIRNYKPNDLEDIVKLINANDAIEKIEDGTSFEELHSQLAMPGINPEQNAFVAQDAKGTLLGYANLRLVNQPNETSFRTWFVVHPDARPAGLETALLERLYTRAQERLDECKNDIVNFHTIVNLRERNKSAVIEKFGMREIRRFWQMVCPLDAPIAEPEFPSGIIIRAYRVRADDVKVHAADNEAFRDHYGHAEEPLERWLHYVSRPFFRPDLTAVAEDVATREIAGFCTIVVNTEENQRIGIQRGWIDILGVRRPWRKRGIGTALLVKCLRDLRDFGLRQASLGCDSENITGATRIYERVGFAVAKTRAAFAKPLRGALADTDNPEKKIRHS
jgi:mycothiol synthase